MFNIIKLIDLFLSHNLIYTRVSIMYEYTQCKIHLFIVIINNI